MANRKDIIFTPIQKQIMLDVLKKNEKLLIVPSKDGAKVFEEKLEFLFEAGWEGENVSKAE